MVAGEAARVGEAAVVAFGLFADVGSLVLVHVFSEIGMLACTA